MSSQDGQPSSCPVDHSTRSAWLTKARESEQFQNPHSPPPAATAPTSPKPRLVKTRPLSQDRETSTIPRADHAPPTTTPNLSPDQSLSTCSSSPALDPRLASPGRSNWIYPSERMFFDAMRRKSYDPRATDMAAIVPLHNAVNERAWAEIKAWEQRMPWARVANTACGGPRLRSFAGDATKASPRARWNEFLGYKKPFDRHDWVVERCKDDSGVEYVIDFYEGKAGKDRGAVNFYLDVRPKLNSWEGWKMRLAHWIGMY